MDRQTIDQTVSEVQLHRVLYVIKFLRAMVLHLLLALLAASLYFLAGIDGVYPIANDLIYALRAQSIQNQLQGGSIGASGYVIVITVLFATLLAVLVFCAVVFGVCRRVSYSVSFRKFAEVFSLREI